MDLPAWLPTRQPGSVDRRRRRRLRTQREETSRRLVEAGRTAFANLGYAAARVDDVVAIAGTSHGTFYLYFRNKEDLLHRLAVECGDDLDDLTAGWMRSRRRPDRRRGVGRRFVTAYRRHSSVIRVWLERRELDPLMQALANDKLGSLADRPDPTPRRVGRRRGRPVGGRARADVDAGADERLPPVGRWGDV